MMVHAFNPSTLWGKGRLCEFEASQVYKGSSRITKALKQRNPVSKNQKEKKTKQKTRLDAVHLKSQSCKGGCQEDTWGPLVSQHRLLGEFLANERPHVKMKG